MRIAPLLALAALAACTAEADDTDETDTVDTSDTDPVDTSDTDPVDPRIVVAEDTTDGRTIEILADEALHVGLNAVTYRVTDAAEAPIDGLTVTHLPMMDMGDTSHSAPFTQPAASGDGEYASEVVFIMAGGWADRVTVTDGTTESVHEFTMVTVEDGLSEMVMVGMEKWVATLTFEDAPAVGDNPFVLTVHQRASDTSFPPVTGLSVDLEPWMTAMGHGSTGNVDPTYTADGKYEGSANFSMAGAWEVRFTLTDGADLDQLVTFDVAL